MEGLLPKLFCKYKGQSIMTVTFFYTEVYNLQGIFPLLLWHLA